MMAEPIQGDPSLSESSTLSPKKDAADALTLFKNGDYEGALKLWREAAKNNPEMPPPQTIMAQLFLSAQKLQDAKHALDQAIVDVPNDPESYVLLANLALLKQDIGNAESLLQKAEDLMSKFQASANRKSTIQKQIFHNHSMVAEARKDWAGSQKALEELLKLDPNNPSTSSRIAFCMFQQKDIEGALKILRDAAKANPKMPAPESVLGQFYQQAGDLENMKKWMDAAIKASPKNLATRIAAGYAALTLGQLDKVREHAVAAAQIDPKSYDSLLLRGMVAVFQKDFMAAELFFETALRQSPNNMAITNNLALVLIEQDSKPKQQRALEFAEANVKKNPQSSSFASTYGWVLYKLGRLEDAEKALQAAAASGPVSVDTAYYTARLMVDQGRKEDARKVLETALKNKTGLAMYRQEANELLETLQNK
jgi:tetratricopeptide (TPR) repeat protein